VHDAAGDALRDFGAFNIRSSQQLAVLLFDRLKLPRAGKTRGGQARTDQEALERLQGKHPIIDALLDYRKLEKMRSTYLEPLPRLMGADGRIRTTFNQTATATGRLSSSNPNLQNSPIRGALGRRMRACFTAAPGMSLISADYSQIELRVLAHLSQEPALLAAFREGADIHARTAGLLFNKAGSEVTPDERRGAKTINFGLIYGMGPQSLSKSLRIGLNEARDFIARYFSRLSRLKEFYDGVEQAARARGFVATLAGRRRPLPDMHSDNSQMRGQARRQAINTLVQGSAADIIKLAMLAVYGDPLLRSLGARLLLQVHDELLLEAPEAEAEAAATRVADLMAAVRPGGVTLDVPLPADAGVGSNWGEAH
jgi:DNA polymerase-1